MSYIKLSVYFGYLSTTTYNPKIKGSKDERRNVTVFYGEKYEWNHRETFEKCDRNMKNIVYKNMMQIKIR
jgi:hypothetical protein